MNNSIVKATLMILLILAIYTVVAVLMPPNQTSVNSGTRTDARSSESNCLENAEMPCTTGNCSGIRTCVNGQWSECMLKKVCRPGSRGECYENGCSTGYSICNECGTGYGECIFPNNNE